MKWNVKLPDNGAENSRLQAHVEAESIEDAIELAAPRLHGGEPRVGQTYYVWATAEVTGHAEFQRGRVLTVR